LVTSNAFGPQAIRILTPPRFVATLTSFGFFTEEQVTGVERNVETLFFAAESLCGLSG
jgi:hypothetical protein